MQWVNGELSTTLALSERGIQFGDGVFRTMRKEGGRILFWNEHYQKLVHDARVLRLVCPPQALFEKELKAIELEDAIVKIIITRGNTERGYTIPTGLAVNRIITAHSVTIIPNAWKEQGVKVRFADWRLSHQPLLAGVKHLNRLDNVMARAEWNDLEIVESLMLDHEGNVIEGVMSNVFVLKEGVLLTSALQSCGVAGIMRDKVIGAATRLEIAVQQVVFRPDTLLASDGVILTNSVFGLLPVKQCEERQWSDFTLCNQLRALIFE